MLKRREFLSAGLLAASGSLFMSRVAFARTGTSSRLVLVLLRGALDGLAAVAPYGDPDYAARRRELALNVSGSADGALRLDNLFAIHPSLKFLHESFAAKELTVFHAIASPYRERSHFDAQDVLENGYTRPHAVQTGWLNRALAALPAESAPQKERGVSLGQNVPLIIRGPAAVASWSPSRLASLDEDTLERIADMYADDPLLSQRLAAALEVNAIATGESEGSQLLAKRDKNQAGTAARFLEMFNASARFLQREDGPRVAVCDTTGWDTHANEGAAQGQLAARLTALDSGLRTLKEKLGPVWRETAVVVITEFGRTVAVNGTRGTDHGTAGVAFLLGGAVQGGRVITDWPGLSTAALYQGRDLKPTTDLRSMLKGVLAEHLQVSTRALEQSVFPESSGAKPLNGLIRA